MRVIGDNLEHLLEDNFTEELLWLREEFDFLFRFKKKTYSESDNNLANSIIESMISRLSGNIDDKLVDLLSSVIESVVSNYPGLL